jgi:hypothetical protein
MEILFRLQRYFDAEGNVTVKIEALLYSSEMLVMCQAASMASDHRRLL